MRNRPKRGDRSEWFFAKVTFVRHSLKIIAIGRALLPMIAAIAVAAGCQTSAEDSAPRPTPPEAPPGHAPQPAPSPPEHPSKAPEPGAPEIDWRSTEALEQWKQARDDRYARDAERKSKGVQPPAPPRDLDLTEMEEALKAFPKTADGKPIIYQDPSSPVALVYDKSKRDTPVTHYAGCLDRVLACARANTIEHFPACVPMIKRCPDNRGGEDCCPTACVQQFQALISEGKEVMDAIGESFMEGGCIEGFESRSRTPVTKANLPPARHQNVPTDPPKADRSKRKEVGENFTLIFGGLKDRYKNDKTLLTFPPTPAKVPCGKPYTWTQQDIDRWSTIGFAPKQPCNYSYSVVTGPSIGLGPKDLLVIQAVGDLDCDGTTSYFSNAVGEHTTVFGRELYHAPGVYATRRDE